MNTWVRRDHSGLRIGRPRPVRGFPRAPALLLALGILAITARESHAQFSDPCGTGCAAVLVGNSYVFASGTAAAVGRAMGGFSTSRQGIVAWSSGFVMSAVAGVSLSGNGGRQRRAIYAAGVGAVGGGLAGLVLESALGEDTKATRLAATMIGAGLGVALGGIWGAASYDAPAGGDQVNVARRGVALTFRLGL